MKNSTEMKCDICGVLLTHENIGLVRNPLDENEPPIHLCKNCYKPEHKKRRSSYFILK